MLNRKRAPGAGRPRSPTLDQTIRRATVELLVEVGYDQLTIEAVAARAGVPRSAIYRRYRSKIELVWNSVYPPITKPLRLKRRDFRSDLRDLIMRNAEFLSRPEVVASAPALAFEFARDPALRDALRLQLNRAVAQALADRIDEAVRAGELAHPLDAATLHDTISGAILYHVMFVNREDVRQFAERLATLMLETTLGERRDGKEPAPFGRLRAGSARRYGKRKFKRSRLLSHASIGRQP